MNQHFYIDQINIRNININIRVLKGQSIAMDNIMSILGTTGTKLNDDLAIPFKIEFSNIKEFAETKDPSVIRKRFAECFEDEVFTNNGVEVNTIDVNLNGGYVIVWCRSLGNNDRSTWTDINGEYITKQRSELTSHILDAVKSNMGFNCNSITLGNKALLISFPISFNVDLKNGDSEVRGVNRFIYSDLIESQSIIEDLIKDTSVKIINNPFNYTNISFNNVRSNYIVDGIYAAAKLLGKDFNKRIKEIFSEYKDNVGFSKVIKAIENDLLEEHNDYDSTLAHNRLPFLSEKQVAYGAKILKELSYMLNVESYDMDSHIMYKTKSISELDKYFKLGQTIRSEKVDFKKYLDFINRELEILDYYQYCDNAVNVLKRAQGVLITEKKGAGPKTSESYKLFDSIAALDNNITALKTSLKKRNVPEEMIDDLFYDYYSTSDFKTKHEVIENHLEEINEYLKEIDDTLGREHKPIQIPSSPLLIQGKSMLEAIYPSLVDENWSIKDSAYPILQQQLISTNKLSTMLFGELFVSEDPKIKNKINYLLSLWGQTNNAELKEELLNYSLMANVRELDFFQSEGYVKEDSRVIDGKSILLGALNITVNKEGKRSLGNDFDLSLFSETIESWANHNKLKTHKEKIEAFKRLPVALQLSLIKNTLKFKPSEDVNDIRTAKLNPNHIISLLRPSTNMKGIIKRGYIPIYTDESNDIDYTRDSFYQLINSPDEYFRVLGENIIRYTFWIYGLDFGKNASKYIPIDLFGKYKIQVGSTLNKDGKEIPIYDYVYPYKTNFEDEWDTLDFKSIDGSSDKEVREYMKSLGINNGGDSFRDPKKSLSKYSDYLYLAATQNILLSDKVDIFEFGKAFIKSHFENNRLVPYMERRYIREKGKSIIKPGTPTFIKTTKNSLSIMINPDAILKDTEKWSEDIDEGLTNLIDKTMSKISLLSSRDVWDVASDIIIERKEIIDNGEYANNNFLKTNEPLLRKNDDISSKLLVKNGPTGKLYMRYETNGFYVYYPINRTLPMEFNETVNSFFMYGIEAESDYQKIADVLTAFLSNYSYTVNKVVSNNSTTSAYDNILSNYKDIIYIENNATSQEYIDKKNLFPDDKKVHRIKIQDLINKTSSLNITSDSVAIIGDSVELNDNTKYTINKDIYLGLNYLLRDSELTKLGTIDNGGISGNIINYIASKEEINTEVYSIHEEDPINIMRHSVALDMGYINGDSNSLPVSSLEFIDTLHDIEKIAIGNTSLLRQELTILGGESKKLKELEAQVKGRINNLTDDINNIDTYIDVFQYNMNVLNETRSIVNLLPIALDDDSIVELFETDDLTKRKEFTKNLYKIINLIASQKYIEDIPYISEYMIESAEPDLAIKFKNYNNALKILKDQHSSFKDFENRVNEAVRLYFGMVMTTQSRNNYFDTLYTHLQNQLAEKGFDSKNIDPFKVDKRIVAENIRKMLRDNIDVAWLASKIDPASQSGIPIIDTVLNEYETHVLNSEQWGFETQNKLVELFNKYNFYDITRKGKVDTKHSKDREIAFKDKFINSKNGNLILPFDTEELEYERRLEVAKIYEEYINEIEKINKSKETDDTKDSLRKKAERTKIKKLHALKESKYVNKAIRLKIKTIGSNSYEIDMNYAKSIIDEAPANLRNTYIYYIRLFDRYLKSKNKSKFADIHKFYRQMEQNREYYIFGITIPQDEKYINSKFKNLSENEINFLLDLQELFAELNDVAMPNTIKPSSFFPVFMSANNKDIVKQILGWQDLQEDDYRTTLAGETQYYLKATALNKPKVFGLTKLDFSAFTDETRRQAIENARKQAEKIKYGKTINTLVDVVEFNNYLYKIQTEAYANRMNLDPFNATLSYINQLKFIKVRRDFEPELYLLQTMLRSKDFKTRSKEFKGDNPVNKFLSMITGNSEYIGKSGAETRSYEMFKAFLDMFEGKNKITNRTDQIIGTLYTSNSRSLMWMNLTSALKNFGTGHLTIVGNAVGGTSVTQKALLHAHKIYFSKAWKLISSLGEYESDDLYVALMKYAGNIFEDHNEAAEQFHNSPIKFTMAKWDNVMYFPNTAGDHYLQFTTFLATLETHRLVDGAIMDFEQYTRSIRKKVLYELMNEEQKKEYEEYVEKINKHRSNNSIQTDTITDFVLYKGKTIDSNFKKEFIKRIKDEKNLAETEFNKLPTVYDCFELVDGRAKIKEDSGLTIKEFASYLSKVKGINHSLFGIYNTFDKSAFQAKIFGDAILQFRKWVRTNWIRFMGKRVDKTVFDERMQAYRSGIFVDALHFITDPVTQQFLEEKHRSKYEGDGDFTSTFKGILKAFLGLKYMFKDWSIRYNVLPETKKANLRIAAFNNVVLLGLSLLAGMLKKAADDDDELNDSIAYALLCYTIYGVQTELYETTPIGMYSFYRRTMEKPIPFEASLNNVTNLMYWTMIAPVIEDEEDLVYDRGTYDGMHKTTIATLKTIPLVNQYFKFKYLPKNNTYYMKQNPLLQTFIDMFDEK